MPSYWFKFCPTLLSFILHYYLLFTFTYRSRLVWKGKIWRLRWEATQHKKLVDDEMRGGSIDSSSSYENMTPTLGPYKHSFWQSACVLLFQSSSSSSCPQFMFDNRYWFIYLFIFTTLLVITSIQFDASCMFTI